MGPVGFEPTMSRLRESRLKRPIQSSSLRSRPRRVTFQVSHDELQEQGEMGYLGLEPRLFRLKRTVA